MKCKYSFIHILLTCLLCSPQLAQGQNNLYLVGQFAFEGGQYQQHIAKRHALIGMKTFKAGMIFQCDSINGHGIFCSSSKGSITDTSSKDPLALHRIYSISYFYNHQKFQGSGNVGLQNRFIIGANKQDLEDLRPDLFNYSLPDRYDSKLFGFHIAWEAGPLFRLNKRNDYFFILFSGTYRYNETDHVFRYYDKKQMRYVIKSSELTLGISAGLQFKLF